MGNNPDTASNQRIHHNQATVKCPTIASNQGIGSNQGTASSRGTAKCPDTANSQSIRPSSRATGSNQGMGNGQAMASSRAQGSSPTHQDGIPPSQTPDVVISRRQGGKRRGGRRHIPAVAVSARVG